MSIVGLSTNAKDVAKGLDISRREMRIVMHDALEKTAQKARGDYQRVTKTWHHKPDIVTDINTRGGQIEMMVGTDDKIFAYVYQGTGPHAIKPKRAKALRFFSGFRPKTTPGHLGSGAGGVSGNIIFSQGVWHPGTKARRFTEKIQKRLDKYGPRFLDRALQKWARRRGR